MNIHKRKLSAIIALGIAGLILSGCENTSTKSEVDTRTTQEVGANLAGNQPTPTDIDYSLERYNLIRRAYWVNGQREKANALVSEVEKPLGYITLFSSSGAVIHQFIVDGKVTSLNSYLTPDSEVYEVTGEYADSNVERSGTTDNDWLPDVDGAYGENDTGIFFFTPDGKYLEWTADYLYSDIPFEIKEPVLQVATDVTASDVDESEEQ